MNPELNPEFDEVLLTAYLDDEVTDEERALVERQLRNSESSRKLLEELRSVRNLVVQLNRTQPSRSFQQGPWNDNKENQASSKVVLNDHRASWNKSFQRLASLAALIAIAACVSVLMFGPRRDTMALTEGVKKKMDRALPTENSPQDAPTDSFAFTPMAPSVTTENALPLAKAGTGEAETKEEPKQEPLGRAAQSSGAGMGSTGRESPAAGIGRTGRAAKESREIESTAGLPGAAGLSAPRSANGPGGANGAGGFGNSMPAKPMAKQKEDAESSNGIDPAPAALRMLVESDAGATKLGKAQAPGSAPNTTPSELYFLLPLIEQGQGDWLAINGRIGADAISDKEDRNLVLKEVEASPKSSPSSARYTYRFRGTVSNQDKASLEGLDITEKRSSAIPSTESSLGAALKTVDDTADPFVIELQVPADKWESGSERLRKMGFDVPIELPQTEYLDFVAIQIPSDAAGQSATTNTAANPTETDGKVSKTTPALGRQFQRIELSRNELDSKQANVAFESSKDEREGIEPAGKTKIRVRVIKKE